MNVTKIISYSRSVLSMFVLPSIYINQKAMNCDETVVPHPGLSRSSVASLLACPCIARPRYDGSVPEISIRLARPSDSQPLALLCSELWPDDSPEGHARSLARTLAGHPLGVLPQVVFVAESSDAGIIGFLEAGLRSHADGCDPAQPVGYVEGWYIAEPHRHRGIGARLLAAAEEWARSHGCLEMASDTWIDNVLSQRVHEALGFEVVDRCVHYRKPLSATAGPKPPKSDEK
jgi:aminoglycoside 6'-N-acetyltransferase I